jgi:hypothetical protein
MVLMCVGSFTLMACLADEPSGAFEYSGGTASRAPVAVQSTLRTGRVDPGGQAAFTRYFFAHYVVRERLRRRSSDASTH